MNELWWMALKAFVIAVVLTPIMRDVFRSYNIVDRPGQRKVHAHPIPRIGGIPIAIAYVVALATGDRSGVAGPNLPPILPGAAVIFLTGLLDDFVNLRPVVKLAGQIVAALLVFWGGVRVETVAGFDLGIWLSLPVTVFWLTLVTNAFNLIDGLDGLCAGVGLVATLAMAGAALIHGNHALLTVVVPLSGALVGFLCYNSNPATVFLGDSGALLIGFLLGCYGMVWTQKTETVISLVVPLLAFTLPLLDVTLSIIRRSLKGQPVFSADRGHIHHRLLDRGLTPRRAAFVLYLVAGTAAGFAMLLSSPQSRGYEALVIFAAVTAMLLGIRQLRYAEFGAIQSILRGGNFERDFQNRLKLEQLEQKLQRSADERQWWETLQDELRSYGFAQVAWESNGRRWESCLSDVAADWDLEVTAGPDQRVEIRGTAASGDGMDPDVLKHVIRRSLRSQRGAWEAQQV